MAVIGQVLATPEAGWRRYDNKDSRFVYDSKINWVEGVDARCYGGTAKQVTGVVGARIQLKFTGTKFRYIYTRYTTCSRNVTVKLDGVIVGTLDMYSEAIVFQALIFELIGLPLGEHTVELIGNDAGYIGLDAVDIDDTGRLMHPVLTERATLDALVVGDVISCEYTATSSMLGTFANLGSATKPEISRGASATPDGSFYFIYVGHDVRGRKKFIADRVIQHSISWEAINNVGFIFGGNFASKYSGIALESYEVSSWLLDGGVSGVDKDNSWDKIIGEYNLEGKITSGNDLIWNYSTMSEWTSTTDTGNIGNRVKRGTTLGAFSTSPTNTISTTIGYRPVIYVEEFFIEKFMILKDSTYYGINDFTTTGTLTDSDISINGIEKIDIKTIVTQKNIQLPFKIIEFTSLDKQLLRVKLFKDYVKLKSKNAFKITHLKELNNFNCVGSNIKFALSLDNIVWKKYSGTSWETVDLTSINSTLFNSLNSLTEINTLSDVVFKQMLNVDSEFYLFIMFGKEGELDTIQMNIDLEGYFKLISSDVVVDEEKEEFKIVFPQDGNYRVKYQKLN